MILIKNPGTNEEQVFFLRPGRNTLGSGAGSDCCVPDSRILPHHLNLEISNGLLVVSRATGQSSFLYQGSQSSHAVLKPGETFSIGRLVFAWDQQERDAPTVHRGGISPYRDKKGKQQEAQFGDLQITGFVSQKAIEKFPFTIGRNPNCDLILNHPQVSAFHAQLLKNNGEIWIKDLRSSNGTFVSNVPVAMELIRPGETIVIMPFSLIFTGSFLNVYTLQYESKLIGWQIDIEVLSKKILDRVTISCSSNELVGLIGPSGSGKTTLMKCLSGQIYPSAGRVQLNGMEIFTYFDLLKRNIGFVPQDDILHRELTVQQTLMYSAKLRLPHDMSEKERKARVWETLIELELEEQERMSVSRLSGGQRKRVNIGTELLTKPGILFLDEPTSGLDPALDEKLMILFKKLSQDGRITVMTTHLLEHADMFSKIALMHHGRLIFFGTPSQAKSFFGVSAISDLYSHIKERPAEEWQEEFQKIPEHQEMIHHVRTAVLPSRRQQSGAPRPVHQKIRKFTQWAIFSDRFLNIILRDKKNTGILLLQAPLIAFFIFIATANLSSKLFMMVLASLWFGCNNAAREICKELPLYRRERMVTLTIVPYVLSKFVVLSFLVVFQCLVLSLLTPDEIETAYLPLLLCGVAGISLGLLISSIVDSPDKAIALVPIILIPQVLFSGIFGELKGFQKTFGQVMISKWSYNLVKKEFELPSLESKNALEKQIDENQSIMQEAQQRISRLQTEMDTLLDEMESEYGPNRIRVLRADANRVNRDLRKEQIRLESASSEVERAEKKLRENARLFVWIDNPSSTLSDWIMLSVFVVVFLLGCMYALKEKDKSFRFL